MKRFERERAAALRHGPARQDSSGGRWAAWVAWRLDDRADRADQRAGKGGAQPPLASAPPPRPWRSQPLADRHGYDHHTDPDGTGWALAVIARWIGRVLALAVAVPGLLVVAVWTTLVPRTGPVRPGWMAATGACAIAVVIAVAVLARPTASATGWLALAVWIAVSVLAGAWVAREVLGWRQPVTGGHRAADPVAAAPVIELDHWGEAER